VQIGMFCYTGMTPEMVDKLANLSIYLTRWAWAGVLAGTASGILHLEHCI
jgi:aspartate/tyrosine/aromatic aminotransferase